MQNKQKIINTQLYHRLTKYIVPHRKILALALFGMTMMALTLSALPALILHLFDEIFIRIDPALTGPVVLAFITLLTASAAAHFIGTHAIHLLGSKVCVDLRLAMFNQLLSLPTSYYADLTDSDVAARFISDLALGSKAIINATTSFVKDSLTIVFLFIWMLYLNWEFTLFILLFLAVMILISQLMNGYLDKSNQLTLDSSQQVTSELLKSISNYQVIRVHGSQAHESERFKTKTEKMHRLSLRQTDIKTLSLILGRIFTVIIFFVISYFLIQQAHNEKITMGEITSLLSAAAILFLSLNRLLSINKYLLQGQLPLENIFSFLDRTAEEETGTITVEQSNGELVFDNVGYTNGTSSAHPVLDNFSLTIKPGEIVAIIYSSENEKKIFIDLVLRIIQPTSGKIYLDGHHLADLKPTSLQRHIALISHKALLFEDTVAMNIAYGAMRCTNEAKITATAYASHVAAFVREMPAGLQTKVGENGVNLTEIQSQHIAIARALLRDPSILIIDEIRTPAASKKEIKHLQNALENLIQGRTTLIFAHHPPSLVSADQTFRLTNGKLTSI